MAKTKPTYEVENFDAALNAFLAKMRVTRKMIVGDGDGPSPLLVAALSGMPRSDMHKFEERMEEEAETHEQLSSALYAVAERKWPKEYKKHMRDRK